MPRLLFRNYILLPAFKNALWLKRILTVIKGNSDDITRLPPEPQRTVPQDGRNNSKLIPEPVE